MQQQMQSSKEKKSTQGTNRSPSKKSLLNQDLEQPNNLFSTELEALQSLK